jgi:hypothetical protein
VNGACAHPCSTGMTGALWWCWYGGMSCTAGPHMRGSSETWVQPLRRDGALVMRDTLLFERTCTAAAMQCLKARDSSKLRAGSAVGQASRSESRALSSQRRSWRQARERRVSQCTRRKRTHATDTMQPRTAAA